MNPSPASRLRAHVSGGWVVLLVLLALGVVAACSSAHTHADAADAKTTDPGDPPPAKIRDGTAATFRPRFGSSGLVTNEYAYRHPDDPASRISPNWIVTSGSLFALRGAGWTGVIDRRSPNSTSTSGTDSAVFRLVSRPRNFANVDVSFQLKVQHHVIAPGTERHAYDGVHVWLRYASPTQLYALSVMRWDGEIAIKRKLPGGPTDGGSYRTLASSHSIVPVGRWVTVDVSAQTRSTGVVLTIAVAGKMVLRFIDSSHSALTRSGAVGIRGDNTQFEFRDFEARSL